MKVLLDSHIALWAMAAPKKLSQQSRKIIEKGDTDIYVSSASIWELRLKETRGKLKIPENFETILREENIQELPISWIHSKVSVELPEIHSDPFDRILIAQAAVEDLVLVTQDRKIRAYPIATIS